MEVSLPNWLAPRQGWTTDRHHPGETVHCGQKVTEQQRATTTHSVPQILSRLLKAHNTHTLIPSTIEPSIAPWINPSLTHSRSSHLWINHTYVCMRCWETPRLEPKEMLTDAEPLSWKSENIKVTIEGKILINSGHSITIIVTDKLFFNLKHKHIKNNHNHNNLQWIHNT